MAMRITGMASGLDTDSMVKELVSAYEKKGESYTKEQTKKEWKQEAWTSLNTKVKSFFSKYVSEMRFSSSYSKKKTVSSNESAVSVVASANAVDGTQNIKVTSLAKSGYLTGGKLSLKDADGKNVKITSETTLKDLGYTGDLQKLSVGFGEKNEDGEYENKTESFDIDGDTTIGEFVKLLGNSSKSVSANFDETNSRIFINSTKSGVANDFHIEGEDAEGLNKILGALGLTEEKGAVKIDGENSKIVLNGAEFESDSNTYSINGLSISVKDVTSGDGISLTTSTDYDEIYSKIKSFFSEYNSLVNEMSKLYNADAAKDMNPLTSDEKDAMTDDEVEKWETKIKDALLRRDSDLSTLMSAMTNPLLSTYEVNGTKYSLSSFGIATLGYFEAEENERYAYHIDGDEDDGSTSGKTDKLKSMITTNPEDTAEFFQQLIGGLYSKLNAIQSTSNSGTSYGSFYNDKTLKSDIETQKKKVSSWEEKVAAIEEKYYDQFSAMEQAMTKLNSQQSSLSSLLGS